MNYSNMIKTEDTDVRYKDWAEYRSQLTQYILDCLKDNCETNGWIAVWGAGGCNDIEISTLAKSYNLVLIDQDMDKLSQVRSRLGLSSERCKIADVDFWCITDEDYEMFYELLNKGAQEQEIMEYFDSLAVNMPASINLENYQVDCSIVVGLASQLNARFAAMLHLQKDNIKHISMEKVIRALSELNRFAVERLYISLRQLTKKLIITGYEVEGCCSFQEAVEVENELQACFDIGKNGGKFLSGAEETLIKVAGNELWHKILYKAVIMDKLEDAGMCQVLRWPFSKEKYYPMLMLALLVN